MSKISGEKRNSELFFLTQHVSIHFFQPKNVIRQVCMPSLAVEFFKLNFVYQVLLCSQLVLLVSANDCGSVVSCIKVLTCNLGFH